MWLVIECLEAHTSSQVWARWKSTLLRFKDGANAPDTAVTITLRLFLPCVLRPHAKKMPRRVRTQSGHFCRQVDQAMLAGRPRIVILHYCKMNGEYAGENSFVNTSELNYWLIEKRYCLINSSKSKLRLELHCNRKYAFRARPGLMQTATECTNSGWLKRTRKDALYCQNIIIKILC
jgi:hypothetical protein